MGFGKGLTLFLSLYYIVFYICRYSILPIIPFFIEYMGMSHIRAGLIVSSLYIGYAMMLIPSGFLCRRIGSRRMIVVGALISSLSNLLIPLSYKWMNIVVFINGIGQGFIWPSLMNLVARNYSKDEVDYVIGSLLTASIFGPSITFVLIGVFLSILRWEDIFLITSLILFIFTIFFSHLVKDNDLKKNSQERGLKKVLLNRNIWLLGIIYLFFYAVIRGLVSWLPTILVQELGISIALSSIFTGVFPIINAIGGFTGTYVLRKTSFKEKYMMFISFTNSSIILLLLYTYMNMSIPLFLMLFLFISLPEWFFFTLPPKFVLNEYVGLASAIIDTLGYIGSFLGTFLIGLLYDLSNTYKIIFMVYFLYMIFNAFLSLAIRETNRLN